MINPKLISFLKKIKKNNNREWFEDNKEEYKNLRFEFTEFLEKMSHEIARFDPAVKKSLDENKNVVKVFRIHRDARFSKDKTKYKTNISGYVSADPRNSEEPVYYMSVEPGENSFMGGGTHLPEKQHLDRLRAKIVFQPDALKDIEKTLAFKKEFPELLDRSRSLKVAPRGYDSENKAIEYLRLKSFSAGRDVTDSELQDEKFEKNLLRSFKKLYPLADFLR
jgi:uncharacterized protein (TIGR02453 family)